jgi:transcriptional regulator with XRE-family HTH domain
MRIGRMIRLYRATVDTPLRRIADDIGISASTLSRIEKGAAIDMVSFGKLIAWLFTDDRPRETTHLRAVDPVEKEAVEA